MNRERFHSSLLILQAVALATLVRSIAFDRWITVIASTALFVGALAAKRDRAWGVALAFASAIAFPVAWVIGIAPPWFAFVGAAGMMPFMLASKSFAKFDKGATALLATLAVAVGGLGAIGWKAVAWPIFRSFPSLRPGLHPEHGALLVAVTAAAMVAMHLTRRKALPASETTQYRVEESTPAVRIATPAPTERETVDEEAAQERSRAMRASLED